MTINRASILKKDYFISYMKLIINAQACSVEDAKKITFERIFKGNKNIFGKESYQQFMLAYEELKKQGNLSV